MNKLLLVIDMQIDFVTGSLGSPQAQAVIPAVKAKMEQYKQNNYKIILTRDTHGIDYYNTQEGRLLPVPHCVEGTKGHDIIPELNCGGYYIFNKPTFGSIELAEKIAAANFDEIEICGLCTDVCVVSNALILKARLPETRIIVDAECCAGVSPVSHRAALLTMKSCQIEVINHV
jgi:nicotinamidase-related amidase